MEEHFLETLKSIEKSNNQDKAPFAVEYGKTKFSDR